jgi:hypothetical protein
MADTARAVGIGPEIEHKGTVYHFKPLTPVMIGQYEVWLERRACEAIMRQERWMPPAIYAEQMAGWRRDCAADIYAYGGDYFGKSSISLPGLRYATYLSIKAGADNSPEITEQVAAELLEEKRDQVLAALFTIRWLVKPEGNGAVAQ